MIDEKQRGILKRIITEDAFDTMKIVADELLRNWNQNPIDEETAFLTAKVTIGREERKKALVSFFETLEKLVYDK